jgi:hypothetical protein
VAAAQLTLIVGIAASSAVLLAVAISDTSAAAFSRRQVARRITGIR